MEIKLKKLTTKDFERFIEFNNRIRPDDIKTKDLLKEELRGQAGGGFVERYWLEPNQSIIASIRISRDLSKMSEMILRIGMTIDSSHLNIDEDLYKKLLALAGKHKPTALKTVVRENWNHLLYFYLASGYQEIERMWESYLDLANFDPKPFEWASQKASENAIEFKTLAEFEDNEKTQRMVYAAVIELLKDVPHEEGLDIWPFEIWLKRFWQGPFRIDKSIFLAFDDDELVGMSMLGRGKNDDELGTGLTGVKRNHRRKGIAQALKLQAAKYAQDNGFKKIRTSNHSINRPMLSINEAMGFEKEPAWVYLKKELNAS